MQASMLRETLVYSEFLVHRRTKERIIFRESTLDFP
jgi:hypothetical protein